MNCFVYRFHLPIIAKTTEPVNIMMVCKVSVKITAARPPENNKRVNLYLKYCSQGKVLLNKTVKYQHTYDCINRSNGQYGCY